MDLKGIPLLILHIGKKENLYGPKLQQEIDEIIGKIYIRNENQNNEKTHIYRSYCKSPASRDNSDNLLHYFFLTKPLIGDSR